MDSKKKVSFTTKPKPRNADEWVNQRESPQELAEEKEATHRLTLDIPMSLFLRIRLAVALKPKTNMKKEIVAILNEHFPPDDS